MDEAKGVKHVPLIADDQPAEVAKPREETFYFPAAPEAPQRPAVLGLGTSTIAPMGRNHLNA